MSTSEATAQLPAVRSPRLRSLLWLVGGALALVVLLDVSIKALAPLGLDATVEKVSDYAQMACLGVMSTPALAVNGKLVMSGGVPDVEHLKRLLAPVV